jgi:hypothetical protein
MDPRFSLGAMDSRFAPETDDMRIMLFRLLSSSLRLAAGKYSPKWFAINSLGGR